MASVQKFHIGAPVQKVNNTAKRGVVDQWDQGDCYHVRWSDGGVGWYNDNQLEPVQNPRPIGKTVYVPMCPSSDGASPFAFSDLAKASAHYGPDVNLGEFKLSRVITATTRTVVDITVVSKETR